MPVQWFNNEGLHEEAQFIKVIIRGYDADGDGVLAQEEFGTFMTDEDEEDAIDRYSMYRSWEKETFEKMT